MSKLFNHVFKFTGNKLIQRVWFISLFVLCVIPTILAVIYAPIHCDSAYYLAVVERISDGLRPYIDFPLGYSPLVIYLMVLFKNIFSIGINYEFYLTIHFVFQFFCAFLVYNISVLVIKRRDYAFYASILFILASHWNDGNVFLLETPSLLFGLLGIYYTIKYTKYTKIYIGIGVLAAFSFLCKQYGIGFLVLIMFLSCFNNARLKQLFFLNIGFILPIVICFLIWGRAFSIIVSGNYGIKSNLDVHVLNIVNAFWYFLSKVFPVLIIGLFYLPYLFKKLDKQEFAYLFLVIFAILGFMYQFYFWQSMHYFLYIIPFASILSFFILSRITRFKWIYLVFLIFTFFLSFYSTFYKQVYKTYYKHPEFKKDQYLLAQEILKNVDTKKTLFVADIGLIPEYYLTNMIPPNFKDVGYSFGPAINQREYLSQINHADYVINYKPEFDNSNTLIAKKIISKRKIIGVYEYVEIYK